MPQLPSWPQADQSIFDQLGGRPLLELLAEAEGFGSSTTKVPMPSTTEPLTLNRAWFNLPKGRHFLFTYSNHRGLHCVSFENRPHPRSLKGYALSLAMHFNPRTELFRKCYVLPCQPSDLSETDFKKIFKMLTGTELDLFR